MKRNLRIYVPLMLLLVAIGLPTRTAPAYLPHWYNTYAGDFLWAMLIFFLWCVVFGFETRRAFLVALATTYLIEISQLFHPPWLEQLRSIKIFALILGFGFLWSDILAYALGISLGALIDRYLVDSEVP